MAYDFNQYDGIPSKFERIQHDIGDSRQVYKKILLSTHQLNGNIKGNSNPLPRSSLCGTWITGESNKQLRIPIHEQIYERTL